MDNDDNDDDGRDRTNLLVLGVAAVIVIVGGIVMYFVKQNLDLQKCELERRMDCHAIPLHDGGG
ncbi:MAG TPA: hypothetical protein VGG10_16270 [Rhizomicrobium sp.]|jgi:uncharacterized membrane protein